LLFKYKSAFWIVYQKRLLALRTPELTLPFIADNRPLPIAMTRFENSTITGFVLGGLVLAMNACSTSPIPAANILLEWLRSVSDSSFDFTGESLEAITRMLDGCE
jgi:hypothetical protein